jgi:hypothetical protein
MEAAAPHFGAEAAAMSVRFQLKKQQAAYVGDKGKTLWPEELLKQVKTAPMKQYEGERSRYNVLAGVIKRDDAPPRQFEPLDVHRQPLVMFGQQEPDVDSDDEASGAEPGA